VAVIGAYRDDDNGSESGSAYAYNYLSVIDCGACCTGNTTGCVMATESDCTYFGGTFLGWGVDCAEAACPTTCLGDVNGDGEVSVNDILTVVANWGPCS
jgi:hypothetical protein